VLERSSWIVVDQLPSGDKMPADEFSGQLAQRSELRANGRIEQSGIGVSGNCDLLAA
jgi:hypothetical protein